ncbi:MAG: hypothetical protein ABIH86_00495 [Planctomycetota bacterium]
MDENKSEQPEQPPDPDATGRSLPVGPTPQPPSGSPSDRLKPPFIVQRPGTVRVSGITRIIELDTPEHIIDAVSERTTFVAFSGTGYDGPTGLRGVLSVLGRIFGYGLVLWVFRLVWILLAIAVSISAMWLSMATYRGAEEMIQTELAANGYGAVGRVRFDVRNGIRLNRLSLNQADGRLFADSLSWLERCVIDRIEVEWSVPTGRIERVSVSADESEAEATAASSYIIVNGPRLADWLSRRDDSATPSGHTPEIDIRDIDVLYDFTGTPDGSGRVRFRGLQYAQTSGPTGASHQLSLSGIGRQGIGGLNAAIGSDGVWTIELKNWRLDDPDMIRVLTHLRGEQDWWSGVLSEAPRGRLDAVLDINGLRINDLALSNSRPKRVRLAVELSDPDIAVGGRRMYYQRPGGAAAALLSPSMRLLVQRIVPPSVKINASVDFDRQLATIAFEKTGRPPIWLADGSTQAGRSVHRFDRFAGSVAADIGNPDTSARSLALFIRNTIGRPVSLKELDVSANGIFYDIPIIASLNGAPTNTGGYSIVMEASSALTDEDALSVASGWRVRLNLETDASRPEQTDTMLSVSGFAKDARLIQGVSITSGWTLSLDWRNELFGRLLSKGGLRRAETLFKTWGLSDSSSVAFDSIEPDDEPALRLNDWLKTAGRPLRRPSINERLRLAYQNGDIRVQRFAVQDARIIIDASKDAGSPNKYVFDDVNLTGAVDMTVGRSALQMTPTVSAFLKSGELRYRNQIIDYEPEAIALSAKLTLFDDFPNLSATDPAGWRDSLEAVLGLLPTRLSDSEPPGIELTLSGETDKRPWKASANLPFIVTGDVDPLLTDSSADHSPDMTLTITKLPARLIPDIKSLMPNAIFQSDDTIDFSYRFRRVIGSDGLPIDSAQGAATLGPISVNDPVIGLTVQGLIIDASWQGANQQTAENEITE